MNFRSSIYRFLVFYVLAFLAIPSGGELWAATWTDNPITSLSGSSIWDRGTLSTNVDVTLTKNIAIRGTIVIPNGKKLTIDCAGYTIYPPQDVTTFAPTGYNVKNVEGNTVLGACLFKVESGGILEIKNGALWAARVEMYCNIVNNQLDSLDFAHQTGGTDRACVDFTGGLISTAGTVILNTVTIKEVYSSNHGGAIHIPDASINSIASYGPTTLDNCTITRCYATEGAALMICNQKNATTVPTPDDCKVTLDNTTIQYCYSSSGTERGGGAIKTQANAISTLELTNSTITACRSNRSGAGLSWNAGGDSNTKCLIKGGTTFSYNCADGTATSDGGGAVYVSGGNVEFDGGCRLSNNTSSKRGGAVFIYHNGKVTFKQCEINENTTDSYGGGIYLIKSSGKAEVEICDNCRIYNNSTNSRGGGVYLANQGELTMSGGVISGNTAPSGGGVFLNDQSQFTFNGGEVTENESSATNGGGGFAARSGSKLFVNGGTISGNKALKNGAGVSLIKADDRLPELHFDSGSISYNAAQENGGGVMSTGSKVFITGTAIIEGNQAGYNVGNIEGGEGEEGDEGDNGESGAGGESAIGHGGGCYLKGGVANLTGGTIYGNRSNKVGGGLFVTNSATLTVSGECKISENEAAQSGGAICVTGSSEVTVSGGEISRNTASSHYGGGIWVTTGTLTVSGGTIEENEADRGGGISVISGLCTFSGGLIQSNIANKVDANLGGRGGGVFVGYDEQTSGQGQFTMTGGQILDNEAEVEGGGVYCKAKTDEEEGKYSIQFTGGEISRNMAYNGGGVYVNSPNVKISEPGVTVQSNKAQNFGGGIYLHSGFLVVSAGEFLENLAPDGKEGRGGAVYVDVKGIATFENCTVKNNSVGYFGGGLYAVKTSEENRGGLITLNAGCKVVGNTASGSNTRGGGVYIAHLGELTVNGAEISANESTHGAGVFLNQKAKFVFESGAITGNIATDNGGGVQARAGSVMTLKNGLIVGNKALRGGGIYVNDSGSDNGVYGTTTLVFAIGDQKIGLYHNTAGEQGDDLFAVGGPDITSVEQIPNVSQMTLRNYNSATPELFWAEDNEGSRYSDGNIIKFNDQNYSTDGELRLTLAPTVVNVTLVRSGLIKGENALYRVYRYTPDSESEWTVYSELMIYGPEDATETNASAKSVSRKIALFPGKWKIEEIGWAWSYEHDNAIAKEIKVSSSSKDKTFLFLGGKYQSTHEKYVAAPNQYDESVVTNDFSKGESVPDKAAPESSSSFESITPDTGVNW